jgi:DNA-binding beta-propeller fold protein YncE
MIPAAPPRPPTSVDVQALIEAARRRQRRRQRIYATLVAVIVAVAAVGYLAARHATGDRPVSGDGRRVSGPDRSGRTTQLERPGALALGAHGVLYIADEGRDQIMARFPNGTFRLVAGTGKAGFSGDGGPAVHAKLNMPRGMAVGRDGALYVADAGNNRIRVISPAGVISTVVGNGRAGWVRSGTTARAASILDPNAVVFGPDGRLYIADFGDNEVLRLEPNGTVTEIAGNRLYSGVYGIGHAATGASPGAPTGLAFDRAGNLYVAGFAVKTLFMITPRGIMTLPARAGTFYPRGSGMLAEAPDGSVLAGNTMSIVRLAPHGIAQLFDFGRKPFGGVRNFLPQGIAVAPNGEIYTDTSNRNGYANHTALVEVQLHGKPRILWKR